MNKQSLILFFAIILLFSACQQYDNTHINKDYKTQTPFFSGDNEYYDINNATKEIANQLLLNIKSSTKKQNKFVITSFVNLDDFTQTSKFGRVLGESLIDELHTRKFKIIDFRSQKAISVNGNGEFSLTRDINKLRDEMPDALIVVGTYSVIGYNLVDINVRIMNNFTSDVISTAKVKYYYTDCSLLNICKKTIKKKVIITNIPIEGDKY